MRACVHGGLGPRPNYTAYDFTETRQRAGPQQFLAGYKGYLQADAYGGYDGIYVESKNAIKEVACWAHCRRYWWKSREHDAARAHHVLAVIGRLYEIERAATKRETGDREAGDREADAIVRQSLRAEHAAPLLAELKT